MKSNGGGAKSQVPVLGHSENDQVIYYSSEMATIIF